MNDNKHNEYAQTLLPELHFLEQLVLILQKENPTHSIRLARESGLITRELKRRQQEFAQKSNREQENCQTL